MSARACVCVLKCAPCLVGRAPLPTVGCTSQGPLSVEGTRASCCLQSPSPASPGPWPSPGVKTTEMEREPGVQTLRSAEPPREEEHGGRGVETALGGHRAGGAHTSAQQQACCGTGPARLAEGPDSPGCREDVLGAASGRCGRGGPVSLARSGVEVAAGTGRGLAWPSLGRGGASTSTGSGAAGAVAVGKMLSRESLGCFGVVGVSPAAWEGRVGVRGPTLPMSGAAGGPGARLRTSRARQRGPRLAGTCTPHCRVPAGRVVQL